MGPMLGSKADGARDLYTKHWDYFVRWRQGRGIPVSSPETDHVRAYLKEKREHLDRSVSWLCCAVAAIRGALRIPPHNQTSRRGTALKKRVGCVQRRRNSARRRPCGYNFCPAQPRRPFGSNGKMPPQRRNHTRRTDLPGAVNREVLGEETVNAFLVQLLRE